MSARGFTLIELLVALAVGSLALLAAAHIAAIGVQSAGRSEQVTELTGRARLVGDQLRTDLSFAGYGSNGAIGVDPAGWGAAGYVTALGRTAIPAVQAQGAVGFAIGGVPTQPGSDVIQIIVPNPTTSRPISTPIDQGSAALDFDPGAPPNVFDTTNGCDFVYVVDHAAPNGAGRTQLIRYVPGPAGRSPLPLSELTMFPLPRGAEAMCARVSTYWVDANGQLHRSDLAPAGPVDAVGPGGMITTVNANDVVAPGILDLQIAVGFSNAALGATLGNHTFGAPLAGGPYVPPGVADWVEARSVRYTIVARPLRQVSNPGPPIDIPLFEDRVAGGPTIPLSVATQVIAGGVELTNLRYFDEMADSGVVAEPY